MPRLVVVTETETEVRRILECCARLHTPVTFRAAGTSLSGQAVTDSVLVMLGDGWRGIEVTADAKTISLQPGVIGAAVNRRLAPFRRKIGPDPASIDTAMIGGIAANNASGMCCGTAQNSYYTLAGMRVVLADGTVLDTRDAASRAAFAAQRPDLAQGLADLARATREDDTLAGRIRHKFRMKNTTGYSLKALVDDADPVDMLAHLMIGSEGTLGFISEITYLTVEEHAHKASSLILFDHLDEACRAVSALKPTPVAAVELLDRASVPQCGRFGRVGGEVQRSGKRCSTRRGCSIRGSSSTPTRKLPTTRCCRACRSRRSPARWPCTRCAASPRWAARPS